jgi:hypothetical protein
VGKIEGSGTRVVRALLGSPAVGSTTAVHAAVTDDGTEQTISTAITDPDVPRNITATAGGTAADIAAIQVTVNGTDGDGVAITEDLPAFTENTAGTVVGSLAFASVTSIVIPAHDGTGATTAIGTGAKLGLPVPLAYDTVVAAHFGGVRESTRPTVTTSSSATSGNTIALNSTLDGSAVAVDYYGAP